MFREIFKPPDEQSEMARRKRRNFRLNGRLRLGPVRGETAGLTRFTRCRSLSAEVFARLL